MARAQMETGSELGRACHPSGTKCIRLGEGWPKTILQYTIVWFLSGWQWLMHQGSKLGDGLFLEDRDKEKGWGDGSYFHFLRYRPHSFANNQHLWCNSYSRKRVGHFEIGDRQRPNAASRYFFDINTCDMSFFESFYLAQCGPKIFFDINTCDMPPPLTLAALTLLSPFLQVCNGGGECPWWTGPWGRQGSGGGQQVSF